MGYLGFFTKKEKNNNTVSDDDDNDNNNHNKNDNDDNTRDNTSKHLTRENGFIEKNQTTVNMDDYFDLDVDVKKIKKKNVKFVTMNCILENENDNLEKDIEELRKDSEDDDNYFEDRFKIKDIGTMVKLTAIRAFNRFIKFIRTCRDTIRDTINKCK